MAFFVLMFFILPFFVIGPYERINEALSESTKKTLTLIWIALIAIIIVAKVL